MPATNHHLRNPTPQQLIQIRSSHQPYWGQHLTLGQYLKREELLSNTTLTGNGGLTSWALVDPTTNPATILASCESIRKEVFFLEAESSEVRVSHGHGIGSVFTPPEMRGKGYASLMLKMLADELKRHGGESALSALYSDIGKVGDVRYPAVYGKLIFLVLVRNSTRSSDGTRILHSISTFPCLLAPPPPPRPRPGQPR